MIDKPRNIMTPAESLLHDIAAVLEVDRGGSIDEVLTAILSKVRELVGDVEDGDDSPGGSSDDATIAASARKSLGLAPDATSDEVVLAMSLASGDGKAAGELRKMQEGESERLAQERLDTYVAKGVLNPSDTPQMEAALSLSRSDPERFEALLANAPPIIPQGRTEPPTARQTVMCNARHDFNIDEPLKNTTSLRAYMDLQLRDAGYELTTELEALEFTR